ncbi:LysR substrate-binding domain-containing protein [Neisseria bacilliformis]|uniref:LysR substrate-binding domain-containing protein n=1 Tax=Neisseria bacilliformis TaxID=267212 RepID=UPI000667DC94|nr:LysR substrate-binding domain-containing protein [Neisseria bacilliformis]
MSKQNRRQTTCQLMPRLADFQAACPDIEMHIRASYDVADLAGGGADLAVRYGEGACDDADETILFRERFAPVAAPFLLARLGSNIAEWPLVHLDGTTRAKTWWAGTNGQPQQACRCKIYSAASVIPMPRIWCAPPWLGRAWL